MNGVLYYGVLLAAAWVQVPQLLRSGQRREAAAWLLLALVAAILGAIWLIGKPDVGLAELLVFR
jgi:hypothetical protein